MAAAILRAARALGLGVRMHADQFSADHGSLTAAEVGAATADHLECTTSVGLAALKAAGVQPVLLPASVYNLAPRVIRGAPDDRPRPARVLATDFNPAPRPPRR